MDNANQHIDQYFKSELSYLNTLPPADVWQDVVQKLDKKRRMPLLVIWIGLAAGIALLIGFGWFLGMEYANKQIYAQQNDKKKSSIATITAVQKIPRKTISSEKANDVNVPDTQNEFHSTNHTNPLFSTNNRSKTITPTDKQGIHPPINPRESSKGDSAKEEQPAYTTLVSKNAHIPVKLSAIKITSTNFEQQSVKNNIALVAEDKPVKTNVKHWSVLGQFAPLYAYRNITQTGAGVSTSELNKSESGLVAYSGGCKFNYQSSKKISFQAGLYYSLLGYANNDVYAYESGLTGITNITSNLLASNEASTKYYVVNSSLVSINQYTQSNANSSTNYDSEPLGVSTSYLTKNANIYQKVDGAYIQKMRFLEIPILCRYRFLERKVSLHLLGGFGTNILVSSSSYITDGNSKHNIANASLQRINFNGTLGIGLSYRLPNQTILTIEPTMKYFINSVSTNSNSVHPYSFGIYTGLNFNL